MLLTDQSFEVNAKKERIKNGIAAPYALLKSMKHIGVGVQNGGEKTFIKKYPTNLRT